MELQSITIPLTTHLFLVNEVARLNAVHTKLRQKINLLLNGKEQRATSLSSTKIERNTGADHGPKTMAVGAAINKSTTTTPKGRRSPYPRQDPPGSWRKTNHRSLSKEVSHPTPLNSAPRLDFAHDQNVKTGHTELSIGPISSPSSKFSITQRSFVTEVSPVVSERVVEVPNSDAPASPPALQESLQPASMGFENGSLNFPEFSEFSEFSELPSLPVSISHPLLPDPAPTLDLACDQIVNSDSSTCTTAFATAAVPLPPKINQPIDSRGNSTPKFSEFPNHVHSTFSDVPQRTTQNVRLTPLHQLTLTSIQHSILEFNESQLKSLCKLHKIPTGKVIQMQKRLLSMPK